MLYVYIYFCAGIVVLAWRAATINYSANEFAGDSSPKVTSSSSEVPRPTNGKISGFRSPLERRRCKQFYSGAGNGESSIIARGAAYLLHE